MASGPQAGGPAPTVQGTLTSQTGVEVRVEVRLTPQTGVDVRLTPQTGVDVRLTPQTAVDVRVQGEAGASLTQTSQVQEAHSSLMEPQLTRPPDSTLEEELLNNMQKISFSSRKDPPLEAYPVSPEELEKDPAPPVVARQRSPVPVKEQVVFALQTTGVETYSHILQIAALNSGESFCKYVRPKRPITSDASTVNGLSFDEQRLFLNGETVPFATIRQALTEFLEFLGDQPVTLVAHNAIGFDSVVLLHAISACSMMPALEKHVTGFVDTLPLFQEVCPKLSSYKQEALYRHFFEKSYRAHDALSTVTALRELLALPCVTPEAVSRHCFDLAYIKQCEKYSPERKKVRRSWEPLVTAESVSKYIADKAATSGLDVHHLRLAYHRKGEKGVQDLLSETGSDDSPRVTKEKKVIRRILNYIAQHPGEENE